MLTTYNDLSYAHQRLKQDAVSLKSLVQFNEERDIEMVLKNTQQLNIGCL